MLLIDNSDRSWEQLGREQPYYGVLSGAEYRAENMSESARERFFLSGEKHLGRLLPLLDRHFGTLDGAGTALDFGCGAGRVTVPLARRFAAVVGVDISPSMLREAEANCTRLGIGNARFLISSDRLADVPAGLAFIHSALVFQHIPRRRGEALFARLLERLAPRGVAALHLYLAAGPMPLRAAYRLVRNRFLPVQIAANLVRRRPWREPVMQMNEYEAGRLLAIAAAQGVDEVAAMLARDGGTTLLLRKS